MQGYDSIILQNKKVMAAHNDFGTQGEDIAIQYLRTKGYDILDKNWRSGHKEIDIVARRYDTIVFVEVKARANVFYGKPEDAVDFRKMRNLINAADAYLRLYMIDLPCRFDVITITGAVQNPYICHIEQAFRP